MEQNYKLTYIEHIMAEGVPFDGETLEDGFINASHHLSYNALARNTHPSTDLSFLIRFEGDEQFRQFYFDANNTPGFVGAGEFELYDYGYFGNCALPVDIFRREALIGDPLLWGIDFAEWYAKEHRFSDLLDSRLSRSYLNKIWASLCDHQVKGEAVILSAPGQEIYGHWILDVVARLHVLAKSSHAHLPIYYDNLPQWADYFIESFGFARPQFRKHPSTFFKIEKGIIPSSSKSGARLGADSLRDALNTIPRPNPDVLRGHPRGEKIYFSRNNYKHSTRRSIYNNDEIEALARDRGYLVVSPENLTIAQQIALMQDARIIVGEDGSALHNIVFCHAGARLGVLSLPERTNTWHMGLCHIMGHLVGYCQLPGADNTPLDANHFSAFLDVLESA